MSAAVDERADVEIGIFLPTGNNGWLVSETAPQYLPTYELNRRLVTNAERNGFDFAFTMVKFRGFGGKTEFWDYNLESFTLLSALGAVTERIKLFASAAILTLPPAILARMAVTADSVAPGRFGVNIVSGWQSAEYTQMGLWPGDDYFRHRYDYATEYVTILRELWSTGVSDFKGEYFAMDDCRVKPLPSTPIEVVGAGQSERGMRFCAEHCDYHFVLGVGMNTPTAHKHNNEALRQAVAETGRQVATYVVLMVIADETDEAARARWRRINEGIDVAALAWLTDQGSQDKNLESRSTAAQLMLPEGAVNLNIGTLVGSYASVARMLDEAAAIEGTKGILLAFDDFDEGVEAFGSRVQPLMTSRAGRLTAT